MQKVKLQKRKHTEVAETDGSFKVSQGTPIKKKIVKVASSDPIQAQKKLTTDDEKLVQEASTKKQKVQAEASEKNSSKEKSGKDQEKKSRYILYVTNIPYDATKEDIQKHFGCLKEKLVSIRMLTDKGTGQFRGTCFIDCADKESYAVALKLHHTKLLGRKIVVEPTVGGGGKGENRTQRLNRKREKFSEVRKKRIRKSKAQKQRPNGAGGTGGGASTA